MSGYYSWLGHDLRADPPAASAAGTVQTAGEAFWPPSTSNRRNPASCSGAHPAQAYSNRPFRQQQQQQQQPRDAMHVDLPNTGVGIHVLLDDPDRFNITSARLNPPSPITAGGSGPSTSALACATPPAPAWHGSSPARQALRMPPSLGARRGQVDGRGDVPPPGVVRGDVEDYLLRHPPPSPSLPLPLQRSRSRLPHEDAIRAAWAGIPPSRMGGGKQGQQQQREYSGGPAPVFLSSHGSSADPIDAVAEGGVEGDRAGPTRHQGTTPSPQDDKQSVGPWGRTTPQHAVVEGSTTSVAPTAADRCVASSGLRPRSVRTGAPHVVQKKSEKPQQEQQQGQQEQHEVGETPGERRGTAGAKAPKHKICGAPGCQTTPSFGFSGTKAARFCSLHKDDGMIAVKNPPCTFPGCFTRPHYGPAGERPTYCALHKTEACIANPKTGRSRPIAERKGERLPTTVPLPGAQRWHGSAGRPKPKPKPKRKRQQDAAVSTAVVVETSGTREEESKDCQDKGTKRQKEEGSRSEKKSGRTLAAVMSAAVVTSSTAAEAAKKVTGKQKKGHGTKMGTTQGLVASMATAEIASCRTSHDAAEERKKEKQGAKDTKLGWAEHETVATDALAISCKTEGATKQMSFSPQLWTACSSSTSLPPSLAGPEAAREHPAFVRPSVFAEVCPRTLPEAAVPSMPTRAHRRAESQSTTQQQIYMQGRRLHHHHQQQQQQQLEQEKEQKYEQQQQQQQQAQQQQQQKQKQKLLQQAQQRRAQQQQKRLQQAQQRQAQQQQRDQQQKRRAVHAPVGWLTPGAAYEDSGDTIPKEDTLPFWETALAAMAKAKDSCGAFGSSDEQCDFSYHGFCVNGPVSRSSNSASDTELLGSEGRNGGARESPFEVASFGIGSRDDFDPAFVTHELESLPWDCKIPKAAAKTAAANGWEGADTLAVGEAHQAANGDAHTRGQTCTEVSPSPGSYLETAASAIACEVPHWSSETADFISDIF